MASQVGEAVIKLKFDGKNVTAELNGVEKEVEKSGKTAEGVFSKISKVAKASFAAASTAAAGFGAAVVKSAVSGFADYEQLVGGVETLFKDSADTIMKYADEAYKTAGLSANEYMETATSFSASLLQGLGGDTAKAAEIANKAITDMSDNANKMGTDMGRIQDAYQGFAKQNYTMLDNLKLGYGGTASEMARLINDSGVMGNTMKVTAKNVNEVSFDKMIEAIHVVQDQLGITGTTALEADKTISGSVKSMQSAWKNLTVGIADDTQDFDQLVNNFITSVGTVGQNILPTIQVALQGVSSLIGKLAPEIIKVLPGLINDVLPSFLSAVVEIVQAIIAVLPGLINGIIQAVIDIMPAFIDAIVNSLPLFIDGLIELLNGIVAAIPTIIPQLVMAITNLVTTLAMQLTKPEFLSAILKAAVILFMELVKAVPQILTALIGALPDIITNIVSFLLDPNNLSMIIQAAGQLFMGIVMAVPQILGALIAAFGSLVGKLWDWIKNTFGEFAANFGNFIGNIFKGAINGVITFIENFINAPIDLLNGFIGIINDNFGWIGVNIGYIDRISLPRLAQGGVVNDATTAIIGEDGQEAVLPLEKNTGNWAGLLAQTLATEMQEQGNSGTINVYMTNQIDNRLDAEEIGRVMMQSIRRAA